MAIRAVLFDIGGVLEITPRTGWQERWEAHLGLEAGRIEALLHDVFRAGSVGAITEAEAEQRIAEILELDRPRLDALMADLWEEYLGEPNVELIAYFAARRPRYKTGILSNSFVGAREKEQARYGFGDLCDVVVYSHEEGMEKPDPRFFGVAWTRLGVDPHEIVFLDDVVGHVEAARALGIHVVLFSPSAIADIERLLALHS